jgi:type II secretory pathway pseudopilin PulG
MRGGYIIKGGMWTMKGKSLTINVLVLVTLGAIVVAAVAPSFINARVRNRVARVKADFAHLAAAIEAYYTDNSNYPNDAQFGWAWYLTYNLTSPIAYVDENLFTDPFGAFGGSYRFINYPANDPANPWKVLPDNPRPAAFLLPPVELNRAVTKYGLWRLSSRGPDGYNSSDLTGSLDGSIADTGPGFSWTSNLMIYDPTNGMISCGDIARCQKTGEVTQMGGPEF